MGRRLRVSSRGSPMTHREVLPWGMHKPWAESNSNKISELIPFTVTGLPAIRSSSLPFCLRFNVSLRAPGSYRHAAKLDTGRMASTYPGGISPRLSIRPCQSARASYCYFASVVVRTGIVSDGEKTSIPIIAPSSQMSITTDPQSIECLTEPAPRLSK